MTVLDLIRPSVQDLLVKVYVVQNVAQPGSAIAGRLRLRIRA